MSDTNRKITTTKKKGGEVSDTGVRLSTDLVSDALLGWPVALAMIE